MIALEILIIVGSLYLTYKLGYSLGFTRGWDSKADGLSESTPKQDKNIPQCMKNALNCKTFTTMKCPYALDNEDQYILTTKPGKCPCDNWLAVET